MYLGSHAHAPQVSEADLHRVTHSHHEFLGSFLGRCTHTHTYTSISAMHVPSVHGFLLIIVIISFILTCMCSTEKAKEAIIYSYKRHINGFAATLEEEEAAQIASMNINLSLNTYINYFSFFGTSFTSIN